MAAGFPLNTDGVEDLAGELDVPALPAGVAKATTPWGEGLDFAGKGSVTLGGKALQADTFTLFTLFKQGNKPGGLVLHRGNSDGLGMAVQDVAAYPVTLLGGKVHNENLTPFSYGPDEWYAYAMTYDHGSVSVYLNGTLVHQYTDTTKTSDEPWMLGDGDFSGALGDVRIYDRPLTPEELKSIQEGPDQWKVYEGEKPDEPPDPVEPRPEGTRRAVWRRIDGYGRRTQYIKTRVVRARRRR